MASKITTCLWFDTQGEEAAEFYCSIIPNSAVHEVSRYGVGGPRPEGSAMTVAFELDGKPYVALNGGPQYTFNEAVSLQVSTRDQEETDYYWDTLSDGGQPGPCGWVKDRFGLSWQVVPQALPDLLGDPDPDRAHRAMKAMMSMGKIDIQGLRDAADSA